MKQKRIVFFIGEYNGYVNTNKLIAISIAKELIKRDCAIELVSFSYRIEESYKTKIKGLDLTVFPANSVRSKIYNKYISERKNNGIVLTVLKHPLITASFHLNKYNKHADLLHSLEKLISEKRIDTLVCFFFPFYPSHDILLDRNIKSRKIAYQFDSWGYNELSDIKKSRRINEEVDLFKASDSIFTIKTLYEVYSKDDNYSEIIDRMNAVEIPNICHEEIDEKIRLDLDRNAYNILYVGTIDDDNRNPREFLNLVENTMINKNININVYFIGRNNSEVCKEYEKKKINGQSFVYNLGPVTNDEANSYLYSDEIFLLNIGNNEKMKNQIPSKVYNYISTGKPVINYLQYDNDITKKIFSEYDLIYEFTGDEDIDSFYDFLVNNKCRSISFNEIKEKYYECTPEYVADKLLSKI